MNVIDLDFGMLLSRIASFTVMLYAFTSAASRLGFVPGRVMKWWENRWRTRIDHEDKAAILDDIAKEFRPNHGSSLRDVVDTIGRQSVENGRMLIEQGNELRANGETLHHAVATLSDHITNHP